MLGTNNNTVLRVVIPRGLFNATVIDASPAFIEEALKEANEFFNKDRYYFIRNDTVLPGPIVEDSMLTVRFAEYIPPFSLVSFQLHRAKSFFWKMKCRMHKVFHKHRVFKM